MARYGFTVTKTRIDGAQEQFTVSECETPRTAILKAYEWAYSSGWRPAKWWELWRHGDTKALEQQFPKGIPET